MWNINGPQGHEARKIRHLATHYIRGVGLDIGCGTEKIRATAIGIDSGVQWGQAVADISMDGSDLSRFADSTMDYVFSSHFLEHTVNPLKALHEWWRVIRPGGCLVLYLPHADYYPRCGTMGANPDHKHDFVPKDIVRMMRQIANDSGCTILEDEERCGGNGLTEFSEYSFFQVYQKRNDGKLVADPWTRNPRSCLVIRYGGYGDGLIAASILPALKEANYHVTWNGTQAQYETLKHDPHIDAWWLQDKNQIDLGILGEYWGRLAERYDRVINLCETMEGDLLRMPGRLNYSRPKDVVHAQCNVNYGEYAHQIAGVPYAFRQKFYFERDELPVLQTNGRPLIVWQLGGSSFHKMIPTLHAMIVQLLHKTDAHIICTGGPDDEDIQNHVRASVNRLYGPTNRVEYRAGTQTIRESILTAMQADVVVGPETGVMNAVASEAMAKVIFLSHSSHENLTKHWVNTHDMVPQDVDCYPCHKMHIGNPGTPGWQGCCPVVEETRGAACASSFKPHEVVQKIMDVLKSVHASTSEAA